MTKLLLRFIISILGILLCIYSGILFYTTDRVLTLLTFKQYTFAFAILVIGYILFRIGREWKNIFWWSTKVFLNLSLLFLVIGLVFFSFGYYKQETLHSIQPSIDVLLLGTLPDQFKSQIKTSSIPLTLLLNNTPITLNPSQLTINQTNTIANALTIPNTLSFESKTVYVQLVLSAISSQTKQYSAETLSRMQIPFDPIIKQLPTEMSILFKYDIFNPDKKIQQEEISKLRDTCITQNIQNSLCEGLSKTTYDGIFAFAQQSKEFDQLSQAKPFLSQISSIDALSQTLDNANAKALRYFGYTILFLLGCIVTLVIHHKYFSYTPIQTLLKKIFSTIAISSGLGIILLVVSIYLIQKNILFEALLGSMPSQFPLPASIFIQMPIIQVLIQILYFNIYPQIILLCIGILGWFWCYHSTRKITEIKPIKKLS